jgi:hypothetical protein
MLVVRLISLFLISFTLIALSVYVAQERKALGALIVLTGACGIALLDATH